MIIESENYKEVSISGELNWEFTYNFENKKGLLKIRVDGSSVLETKISKKMCRNFLIKYGTQDTHNIYKINFIDTMCIIIKESMSKFLKSLK
jgi:hypothetical protein